MGRYIKEIKKKQHREYFDITSLGTVPVSTYRYGDISQKDSLFMHNRGKKFGYLLGVLFMFCYFVLPQYFGLDVPGFDFTAQRMVIIAELFYIVSKKDRSNAFWNDIKSYPARTVMLLFFFVLFYTGVRRAKIGTLLYDSIEILGMFLFIYVVKYELGVKKTLELIIEYSYLLGVLGIVEYFMGRTPFAYLNTIAGVFSGSNSYRNGSIRIMGPANHALGYGLMLLIMIPIACLNIEKNKVQLFKRPVLLVLLLANVFFTGSRSTLGMAILELGLLLLMSDWEEKRRTILQILIAGVISAVVIVLLSRTSVGISILRQITSVIDQVLGTSFSTRYGANMDTLNNSSVYRSFLPKIFTLSWLNPLIGQGSQFDFYWYVNGFKIQSIDNFYVATYIRYAYPGLITYCIFLLQGTVPILKSWFKDKCGLYAVLIVAAASYLINIWWVDTLQSIKYLYIAIGLYWACKGILDVKRPIEEETKETKKETQEIHRYLKNAR